MAAACSVGGRVKVNCSGTTVLGLEEEDGGGALRGRGQDGGGASEVEVEAVA
jgi:hypothetical protein